MCKSSQCLPSPILLLLSFRWRDGKQYFLVSNRRRVTNRTRKYFFTFFCVQTKVFRGEILFFDHRWMTQKLTKFLWIFISPSPILKYSRKKCILSYLSIGLKWKMKKPKMKNGPLLSRQLGAGESRTSWFSGTYQRTSCTRRHVSCISKQCGTLDELVRAWYTTVCPYIRYELGTSGAWLNHAPK